MCSVLLTVYTGFESCRA